MEAQFRVTQAGRKAWESKDLSVPSDYRFILWVLDMHGQAHTEAFMQQFPGQRLHECLLELAELGLVEHAPGEGAPAAAAPAPSVLAVSQAELPKVAAALSDHGAFVCVERLKERAPSAKAPAETTVLIVEDDADQLALADVRVSMAGYRVQVAESQRAMLRSLADKGVPDLLLLDIMLPDGDGFEILGRLRGLPSFARLPIVLLTAKSAPSDIARGLFLGADGYVTKPYSKSVLAEVIGQILGREPGLACAP